MKITVIGKAHLEGVSKRTGKPYNFNQIHYNAPQRGVEGTAAIVEAVDTMQFPLDTIRVGTTYLVERDRFGRICEMIPEK